MSAYIITINVRPRKGLYEITSKVIISNVINDRKTKRPIRHNMYEVTFWLNDRQTDSTANNKRFKMPIVALAVPMSDLLFTSHFDLFPIHTAAYLKVSPILPI